MAFLNQTLNLGGVIAAQTNGSGHQDAQPHSAIFNCCAWQVKAQMPLADLLRLILAKQARHG